MVLPVGSLGAFSAGPLVENPSPGSGSASGGGSFGQMLASSIGQLDQAQAQASQQTQALATGQATDMSTVVMSVEEASLEISLASQIQNKAVQAYQSIFQTQV